MRSVLFSLLLVMCTTSRAAEPTDIVGLWGSETVSGPLLQGVLTVDGRQAPGQASLMGVSAAVEREGDQLSFVMPGGHGQFRGRLVDGGIEGFWIQPPGQALPSAYATPLVLPLGEDQVWMAHLHPLQERITQYLSIWRSDDGALKAFLGNPEYNLGRGVTYDVELKGEAVVLTDPGRNGWALNGRLDDETGQLRIEWQGIGVFPFTRRERDDAIGFYPSTPASPQSTYRAPVPAADGWRTAALDEVGIDPGPLMELQQQLAATDTRAADAPLVHGLLVARHGKLVFESYFRGHSREQAHDTRSAGKSFASLLVGMATDRGAGMSADTKVLSIFPEYTQLEHVDQDKRAITLGHLMAMNSGLACDDGDPDSPGAEDTMQRQRAERDWYRYTLNLPMVQAPGAREAKYCSGGINLLGGAVRNATGRPLVELFQEWVAAPLQMRGYHINLMPDGDAYLAGGIHMRPRDMLKLGQLYLAGGTWNGRRLVDPEWLKASVAPRTNFGSNHGYGYAWHLHTYRAGRHAFRGYAAEGNGGQFVIVVPELDVVVAITAGNYGQFPVWYALQDLVMDHVIAAVTHSDAAGVTSSAPL